MFLRVLKIHLYLYQEVQNLILTWMILQVFRIKKIEQAPFAERVFLKIGFHDLAVGRHLLFKGPNPRTGFGAPSAAAIPGLASDH